MSSKLSVRKKIQSKKNKKIPSVSNQNVFSASLKHRFAKLFSNNLTVTEYKKFFCCFHKNLNGRTLFHNSFCIGQRSKIVKAFNKKFGRGVKILNNRSRAFQLFPLSLLNLFFKSKTSQFHRSSSVDKDSNAASIYRFYNTTPSPFSIYDDRKNDYHYHRRGLEEGIRRYHFIREDNNEFYISAVFLLTRYLEFWGKHEWCIPFEKNKPKIVPDDDPRYMVWMLNFIPELLLKNRWRGLCNIIIFRNFKKIISNKFFNSIKIKTKKIKASGCDTENFNTLFNKVLGRKIIQLLKLVKRKSKSGFWKFMGSRYISFVKQCISQFTVLDIDKWWYMKIWLTRLIYPFFIPPKKKRGLKGFGALHLKSPQAYRFKSKYVMYFICRYFNTFGMPKRRQRFNHRIPFRLTLNPNSFYFKYKPIDRLQSYADYNRLRLYFGAIKPSKFWQYSRKLKDKVVGNFPQQHRYLDLRLDYILTQLSLADNIFEAKELVDNALIVISGIIVTTNDEAPRPFQWISSIRSYRSFLRENFLGRLVLQRSRYGKMKPVPNFFEFNPTLFRFMILPFFNHQSIFRPYPTSDVHIGLGKRMPNWL